MKTVLRLLVFVSFVGLVSCTGGVDREAVVGKWKVKSMQLDAPNVPQTLAHNAEVLALATVYEFGADSSARIEITANELEPARKQTGSFELKSSEKLLVISPKQLAFFRDSAWVEVGGQMAAEAYNKTIELKIETISASEMVLAESGPQWVLRYTLERM